MQKIPDGFVAKTEAEFHEEFSQLAAKTALAIRDAFAKQFPGEETLARGVAAYAGVQQFAASLHTQLRAAGVSETMIGKMLTKTAMRVFELYASEGKLPVAMSSGAEVVEAEKEGEK